MITEACQSVVFIFCNTSLFFITVAKLWSHLTIILKEQLKLFHLLYSKFSRIFYTFLGRISCRLQLPYVLKWIDEYMCPMYLNGFVMDGSF